MRFEFRLLRLFIYAFSLEMDPFLWSAYKQLCALGANLEPSVFFGDANHFNSTGRSDEHAEEFESRHGVDDGDGEEGRLSGDIEQFCRKGDSGENSSFADATPEFPRYCSLSTPRIALVSIVRSCLDYKTPCDTSQNDDNVHTAMVAKKQRVGKDIGVSARQRTSYRCSLADSDEKSRATDFDDLPVVTKEPDCIPAKSLRSLTPQFALSCCRRHRN